MTPPTPAARLASLDQLRGYTVAGMFLVNFVGSYEVVRRLAPVLAHHNTYFSYADSIMPQFFFAAGFAYRLTFLRRGEADGAWAGYAHAAWRCLGLLLLAFVVHHLDGRYAKWADLEAAGVVGVLSRAFQREYFQTLAHIAVASLWVLPVIAAGPAVRVGYAVFSAVLFHLLSVCGYYEWVMKRPGIDGGPLGFLTWTLPLLAGTLAHDYIFGRKEARAWPLAAWGAALMALGYGLSCLNGALAAPPFVPPSGPVGIWTMSQRAGSVSYLVFGAGFSLAAYAAFMVVCDRWGWQAALFRTLGTNALAAYILHDLVNGAVKPFVPRDSPGWYVAAGFLVSFGICWLFHR